MRLSLQLLRKALDREEQGPWTGEAPALEYPLFPAPRVAVLGARLRPQTGVRSFPQWTPQQLMAYEPMALAGSYYELSTVARQMGTGQLYLPRLRFPLLVFTSLHQALLSSDRHEQLWQWFRLPVFEQIRGEGCELLAYECEAREGFHLAEGVAAARVRGVLLHETCPCGSETQRVRLTPGRVLLAVAAGD